MFKKIKKILLIVGMFFLFNQVQSAKAANDTPQNNTLQFTSANHILGFSNSGIIIASQDHMLKVDFVGANNVSPKSDSPENINTAQKKQIAQFSKVTYENVWNGIDIIYEAEKDSLMKSTYYVDLSRQDVSPENIKLSYNRPVFKDENGNLIISYETGNIIESVPVVWQEINGEKIPVDVSYSIDNNNQAVGFNFGEYFPNIPLIIDPAYTWNTFLGGEGNDNGVSLFLDSDDNVFVIGYSHSTWGNPIRSFSSGRDAFIAKLDDSGNLVWNTFLGGNGNENADSFVFDSEGNVYVSGLSAATWGDDPIRDYSGGEDGFIAKLDSSGNLIWNTFLGGNGNERASHLVLDSNNNFYVSSSSTATWGTPIRAYSGDADTFVAKLDSSGTLTWNTFLGGTGSDDASSLLLDSNGSSYINGRSNTTWGSPIRAYSSGNDGFVAKLDDSGTLTWNTFLGGSGSDFTNSLSLGSDGNIYISGDSLATWGSPIRAYSGDADTFVAKLDSLGTLTWNTFLGGDGSDATSSSSLDSNGSIYINGSSSATWGSPIRAYSSGNDGFVAKLDSSGTLTWNTFLGGDGNDYRGSMSLDSDDNIYINGSSPATWGSPIRAYSSGTDGFVAKLDSSGTLTWNTFLGGSGSDFASSLSLDSDDNIFIASSCSASWGTPLRAYYSESDIADAFAAKVSSIDGHLYNVYTITASAGENGSIDSSGIVYASEGDDKIFTITPDSGYSVADVLVDGESVGAVSSYEFTDVGEEHTISATFRIGESSNENTKSDDEKKKTISPRTIKNSSAKVAKGATLRQWGKKFSKNSTVLLYFSKYGGGYYPPMEIKTNSKGNFTVYYHVTKQKGTYLWYAVDKKTGKKSKTIQYRVK